MCKKRSKKTITRPSNNTREPYLLNCNGTIFLIENSKIGILILSTFHTKRKRRRKKTYSQTMWATARVSSKKRAKQIETFLGGNFCVFGGQIKVVLHTCLPFRLLRINSVNVLNVLAAA